jgi:hypothetical protein
MAVDEQYAISILERIVRARGHGEFEAKMTIQEWLAGNMRGLIAGVTIFEIRP